MLMEKERFEHRTHITLQFGCQVDISDKTVGEGDPKAVAAEVGDTRDLESSAS